MRRKERRKMDELRKIFIPYFLAYIDFRTKLKQLASVPSASGIIAEGLLKQMNDILEAYKNDKTIMRE